MTQQVYRLTRTLVRAANDAHREGVKTGDVCGALAATMAVVLGAAGLKRSEVAGAFHGYAEAIVDIGDEPSPNLERIAAEFREMSRQAQ